VGVTGVVLSAENLTPNPFPSGKGNQIGECNLFPSGKGNKKDGASHSGKGNRIFCSGGSARARREAHWQVLQAVDEIRAQALDRAGGLD
jgi:hypothetical protein